MNPENPGYEFYLIVTPGFESLALSELRRWNIPGLKGEPVVDRGGISLQLESAQTGFELNRVLKIPTRILVRIAQFGCRDFPKLFKKTSQIAWNEWVSPDDTLSFQASSHGSRLFVKKRIEQTCAEGRERYLKNLGLEKRPTGGREISVFVRLNDDVCTVSLDTSGEILHKRGLRAMSSDAPIRETMASAVLQFLEDGTATNDVELVDPMMGAGTFLLEALLIRERVTSREFAFEHFVQCADSGSEVPLHCSDPMPYRTFAGFDASEKAVGAARDNLTELATALDRSIELKLSAQDIFSALEQPPHANRWLVANPPYGERLKISMPLHEYYKDLFAACERTFRPARACFILPEKSRPLNLKLPAAWKRTRDLAFSNGGLPVRAVVYERTQDRG